MEDLTGRQMGQYRIVAPLGEGGMAAVYRAYQPRIERYVAIKVLPRHYASDPTFVGRFEQEARVIANLEHPNILPVHDYGEAEGHMYLVMRYVQGGTLANLMQGKPLPQARIFHVVAQVSAALDYAHTRGVVHRDVKPSNVLIDEQGNCFLTDFGIAKILEASSRFTVTGGFVGTPTYASPEQCLGRELDGRSDVYSLGVVLYEMATGRPPFDAETPMAVAIKQIHDPLPLPSKINPSIPQGVERVILKALAKDPGDRYGTASDMVRGLSAALSTAPRVPAPKPVEGPELPGPVAATVLYGAQQDDLPPPPARQQPEPSALTSEAIAHAAIPAAAAAPLPSAGVDEVASEREGDDRSRARPGSDDAARQRRGRPRWVWVVAGAIGLALVAAGVFGVAALLRAYQGSPATPTARPVSTQAPTNVLPTDPPPEDAPAPGTADNLIVLASFPRPDRPESGPAIEHVAAVISELSGLVVRPIIVPDSRAVRHVLGSGEAHAGWLLALDYIAARQQLGVDAAVVSVRFDATSYRGQIVARADSGIGELPQLRGRSVCMVAQGSRSGSVMARILLRAHGIDPDRDLGQVIEVDNHRQVILAVYHGECDAGATFHDARATVEEEFPDVWEVVAVIATTIDIPNDSLGFSEGIPPEMREAITAALFAMLETDEGRSYLEEAYGIQGLEPIEDHAFNPLREQLGAAGIPIEELTN